MRLTVILFLFLALFSCGRLRGKIGEPENPSPLTEAQENDANNQSNVVAPEGTDGGVTVNPADAGTPPDLTKPLKFAALSNVPQENRFVAVHGISSSAFWIISEFNIYFYDGTRFIAPNNQPQRFRGTLRDIWTSPSESVFVVADDGIWVCREKCRTAEANYVFFRAPIDCVAGVCVSEGEDLSGFCASPEGDLYVVGSAKTYGHLYRWESNELKLLFVRNDLTKFEKCVSDAQGNIFIAAQQFLVRFDPSTENVFVERPDYSTVNESSEWVKWLDIQQVGGQILASGSSRLVATRQKDGAWRVSNGLDGLSGDYRALSGAHPAEVIAWGNADVPQGVARFNGSDWRYAQDLMANIQVRGAWASDVNHHVLVGNSSVTVTRGVVFLVKR